MADRSVKVKLSADVAAYSAAMKRAGRETDGMTAKTSKLGSMVKQTFAAAGVIGGVAAVGAAIKKTFSLGLDFTRQMNELGAVTQATDGQMKQASKTAQDLGNAMDIPATSASDASEAMLELAKGGLTLDQSMQAARGTLMLAAAAQVSGAQAAEIQANALNAFGLSADQAGKVADILANTANAASGEIGDFASSLSFVGSIAHQFDISIGDTATTLGIFANNGLKGSMAGTTLRSMLISLAAPSSTAEKAMEDLGLSVYDAQGNFVGMPALIDQLADAQGRMSDQAFQSALALAFGNRAVQGVSILAKAGADSFNDMSKAVERTGGASDLANAKLKGLPGALEHVQNAVESVALSFYQRLAPGVTSAMNGMSDVINTVGPVVVQVFGTVIDVVGGVVSVFTDLPGPVKAAALAMGAFAVASKVGLISKMTGAVARLRDEMALQAALGAKAGVQVGKFGAASAVARAKVSGLAKGAGALARSLGPAAGFAAGVGVISSIVDGFGQIARVQQQVEDGQKSIADALEASNGKWTEQVQLAQNAAIEGTDFFKAAINAGLDYKTVMLGLTGTQQDFDKMMRQVIESGDDAVLMSANQIAGLRGQKAASENLYEQQQKTLAAQKKLSEAQSNTSSTQEHAIQITADYRDAQDEAKTAAVQFAAATSDAARRQDESKSSAVAQADAIKLANIEGSQMAQWQDEARTSASLWKAESDKIPDTMGNMTEALRLFSDQTSAADTRLQFFTLSVDKLIGRDVSFQEAAQLMNDQIRAIKKAFEDGTKATDGNIESLIRADGTINTVTEAGSKLQDSVEDYRRAYDEATNAARDHALQSGTTTDALKAARTAADKSRQAFIDQATALGISREDAEKMADAMGILEGKKLTPKTLGLYVDDHATGPLNDLQDYQLHNKTVIVDADLRLAQAKIERFTGGRVNRTIFPPGNAAGGAITGPGAKGVDSVLRMLAPGEHVLTDEDVDAMGGQAGVYAFRKMLHSGIGMASGGAVGGTIDTRGLSGLSDPTLGPVASIVARALSGVDQAVAKTAAVAKQAAGQLDSAHDAYQSAVQQQSSTADQHAEAVKSINESTQQTIIDDKKRLEAAKRSQQRAVADAEQRKKDAEQRKREADSDSQRESAARSLRDAITRLSRTREDEARKVKEAEDRLAKAREDRTKKVRDAIRTQTAANKEASEATAKALKVLKDARAAAAAAQLTSLTAGAASGNVSDAKRLASQRVQTAVDSAQTRLHKALQHADDVADKHQKTVDRVNKSTQAAIVKAKKRAESLLKNTSMSSAAAHHYAKMTDAQIRRTYRQGGSPDKAAIAEARRRANELLGNTSISRAAAKHYANMSDSQIRRTYNERARTYSLDAALHVAHAFQNIDKARDKKVRSYSLDAALHVAHALQNVDKARDKRVSQLRGAIRAQNEATKAQAKHVANVKRQTTDSIENAHASAKALVKQSKAVKDAQKAQTRLATILDRTNVSLGKARDKLQGLRQASDQMSSSIAGRITGDASMLGMDAQGVRGLVSGLRSNLKAAKDFRTDLRTLGKRGLNTDVLTGIANVGLAGGPLADALAHASAGQLKNINSLSNRIARVANSTGDLAANLNFGSQIAQDRAIVRAYQQTEKRVTNLMERNGRDISRAVEAGLKGMTVRITLDGKQIDARIDKILDAQGRALVGARR